MWQLLRATLFMHSRGVSKYIRMRKIKKLKGQKHDIQFQK